jgi:hypothetical protein
MWTTSFLPLCTGCECFLPGDSPAAGAGRCGNPQHFPPCPQARCLFAQVIHRLVHRMVSQQNSRRLAHRRHVPAWQPRHPNLNCSRSPQAAIEGPEEMHLHLHGVNARWPSRLPSPSSLGSTCPARRSRHRGHPRCPPWSAEMLTTVTKELLVLQHGDAGRAPTGLAEQPDLRTPRTSAPAPPPAQNGGDARLIYL